MCVCISVSVLLCLSVFVSHVCLCSQYFARSSPPPVRSYSLAPAQLEQFHRRSECWEQTQVGHSSTHWVLLVCTHTHCVLLLLLLSIVYIHTHTLCAAAAVASQRRVVSAALAPAGSRRGRGVGGGEGRAASPCVTPPCVTSPCVPFDVCNLP